MRMTRIELPRDEIDEFCRRYGIRELRLFGSALRHDFRADSDVDFLVEFEAGTRAGLLGLAQMELELSEIVGRKADLRTAGDLSRYFRQAVLDRASILYAA
jgi:predicted nucleotidyltransferase